MKEPFFGDLASFGDFVRLPRRNPMAPARKRQRTSGQNNKSTAAPAASISEVPPACLELKEWICTAYAGRHGGADKRKFPLCEGGSFLELVQRCWADEDALLSDSLTFCQTIGIIGQDADVDAFEEKFMTLQDP